MSGSAQRSTRPRIAITCGEPAGIGYEIVAGAVADALAASGGDAAASDLVVIGDGTLLEERGRCVGARLDLAPWPEDGAAPSTAEPTAYLDSIPLARPVRAGRPDPGNAEAVVEAIRRGTRYCLEGHCDALVTAPVQKSCIIEAGIHFTGHTELLAELTGAPPVMMLAAGELRIALVTTHLPLARVPAAITAARLETVATVLHHDLVDKFAIATPHIVVTGLNPHAGEGGHLGREEIDVIIPTMERLREAGLNLSGPVPADTAFTPDALEGVDAVLAMYHDQGLPVVKHAGFHRTVNITLGLPIVRTSVDHGTALNLAGSGRAETGSLRTAIEMAADLARRREHRGPAA